MALPQPDEPYGIATLMTCTCSHPVPPAVNCHTDSWPPWAIRASNPLPGPAARVAAAAGPPVAPAGSGGSERHAAPGPATATAPAPPVSVTPVAPPTPKAADRTARPRSPNGADNRQWRPYADHAVTRLAAAPEPACSRAAVAPSVLASPSTSVSRRASDGGRAGPVARQVPPPEAKIPTVPGRVHCPASSGTPVELNAAAVSRASPHARPAGDAATERSLARLAQVAPACAATWASPRRVSAIRRPPGAPANASGELARLAESSPPCDQCAPSSRLALNGVKVRSWLGRTAVTSDPGPASATERPPLSATTGGVASVHRAAFAERVNSCQKLLCAALDPPMTTTAQVSVADASEVASDGVADDGRRAACGAAATAPQPARSAAASSAPAATGT